MSEILRKHIKIQFNKAVDEDFFNQLFNQLKYGVFFQNVSCDFDKKYINANTDYHKDQAGNFKQAQGHYAADSHVKRAFTHLCSIIKKLENTSPEFLETHASNKTGTTKMRINPVHYDLTFQEETLEK
ncbi:MAG: hypothetical protein AAF182_01295 [Pseudomonadota bacterium]